MTNERIIPVLDPGDSAGYPYSGVPPHIRPWFSTLATTVVAEL